MPHQLTAAIPVDLDRPRTFKFDFNSVAALSEWTGINVFAGDNPLGVSLPNGDKDEKFVIEPVRLRALVAACLLHEDPQYARTGVPLLPPHKVGALITPDNTAAVNVAAQRAFFAYFGKTLEDLATEADANPTNGAAEIPSASRNSGQSGGTISG